MLNYTCYEGLLETIDKVCVHVTFLNLTYRNKPDILYCCKLHKQQGKVTPLIYVNPMKNTLNTRVKLLNQSFRYILQCYILCDYHRSSCMSQN